jgi:hypothetical protein
MTMKQLDQIINSVRNKKALYNFIPELEGQDMQAVAPAQETVKIVQ